MDAGDAGNPPAQQTETMSEQTDRKVDQTCEENTNLGDKSHSANLATERQSIAEPRVTRPKLPERKQSQFPNVYKVLAKARGTLEDSGPEKERIVQYFQKNLLEPGAASQELRIALSHELLDKGLTGSEFWLVVLAQLSRGLTAQQALVFAESSVTSSMVHIFWEPYRQMMESNSAVSGNAEPSEWDIGNDAVHSRHFLALSWSCNSSLTVARASHAQVTG